MLASSLFLLSLLFTANLLVASETKQTAQIDTLIIEPHEAGDLPKSVAAWLETRDLLIPQNLVEYGGGYNSENCNAICGSFIGIDQKDYAVLTVERSAIDDSCSLWVFPTGDTLAPILLGPYKLEFYAGTNWWPYYGKNSPLGYAWYIRPMSKEWITGLQKYATKQEEFPEIAHEGIFLSIVDKGGGWHYYYNGNEWINLAGAD